MRALCVDAGFNTDVIVKFDVLNQLQESADDEEKGDPSESGKAKRKKKKKKKHEDENSVPQVTK